MFVRIFKVLGKAAIDFSSQKTKLWKKTQIYILNCTSDAIQNWDLGWIQDPCPVLHFFLWWRVMNQEVKGCIPCIPLHLEFGNQSWTQTHSFIHSLIHPFHQNLVQFLVQTFPMCLWNSKFKFAL
jgi:hypothetical protein